MAIEQATTEYLYSNKYTLKDTVDMMLSDDYKQRFIGEFLQLALRLEKLLVILEKHKAGLLDFELQSSTKNLYAQAKAMSIYVQILMDRANEEKIELPVPVASNK